MPVSQHIEYYSVRFEAFLLPIRHKVEQSQNLEPMLASISYGQLHDALCRALVTKSCGHPGTTRDSEMLVPLGPEVATIVGWSWPPEEETLPRICISLVKGDSRARWLALAQDFRPHKETVLRSEDCCVECALRVTTALGGRRVLIL